MTQHEINEVAQAMHWCAKRGMDGSVQYYRDFLCFMTYTGRADRLMVELAAGRGPWSPRRDDEGMVAE